MSAWRVTHMDALRQRHVLHELAPSAEAAEALAEALYGPALYCACIRICRRAGCA